MRDVCGICPARRTPMTLAFSGRIRIWRQYLFFDSIIILIIESVLRFYYNFDNRICSSILLYHGLADRQSPFRGECIPVTTYRPGGERYGDLDYCEPKGVCPDGSDGIPAPAQAVRTGRAALQAVFSSDIQLRDRQYQENSGYRPERYRKDLYPFQGRVYQIFGFFLFIRNSSSANSMRC